MKIPVTFKISELPKWKMSMTHLPEQEPMSDTPRTDEQEAIYRAKWLTRHRAPIDWTVVTANEIAELKQEFAAITKERDALKARIGICVTCGKEFQHECDEPFAHCGCGTTEWPFRDVSKEPLTIQAQYLKAERDALLADKERLDWLERIDAQKYMFNTWIGGGGTLRSAVDAARKEQP